MTQQQTNTIFEDYFNSQYSYNELLGQDGNLQPYWQTFFKSYSSLGADEIQNRIQDVQRLLKENGVTYNIYGDPSGLSRLWKLDLIPFLISKTEWERTEAGLVQRATLLDLILKDIYGERLLIKEGLLPMELVYNHTGFARQCVGIKPPGKHSLVIYAADIARSPDGKIWVINDRTQAPSGAGYALENRHAMAKILPELFNGLKVRRLSTYFNTLTQALNEIAPGQKSQPRIVILTPGPGNETYFEHAYLASHLGFTLVQGDDLMVRDKQVWLKTIGGLEKVDVILRRVDGIYCDPLELKEDSQLGVPGLLQAIRSGNVSIANPIGSSILESPGLMPFLQNISRRLLGADLIIPNIATWWCGQPKEMDYVIANLQSLIIKKIHRNAAGSTSVDGASLSVREVKELKLRIKATPYLYVGQEKIQFSSSPSLAGSKIVPRNALFRNFLVSNNGTYSAMPGGLTRISADNKHFIISNQAGGTSKDTWIISPEPGRVLNLQKELPAVHPAFYNNTIITSHTAENLFWVGRYAERVLNNARYLRSVIKFVAEDASLQFDNDVQTKEELLKTLTQNTFTYPGFTDNNKQKLNNPWPELKQVLYDAAKPGSLGANFAQFNRAVYAVREHWSTDSWRVLRNMEEEWTLAAALAQSQHSKMLGVLDSLITSLAAFTGLNRESISREHGWRMLDTGRKIEQGLLLLNMLQTTLVPVHEEQVAYNLMEVVLKSNESLVNYRYKYKAHIQLPLVIDLMLLDPNNPRSLLYYIERIMGYIQHLPKTGNGHTLPEHEKLMLEAYTLLKLTNKDELASKDKNHAVYSKLEDFLNKMTSLLAGLPALISKTYFKHAQEQKQLFAGSKL
jgi:uncharacterized circularly permuted ATP-grasp superfamily protein/uncharacterized alpha-E superfamily protein